jgi:Uma2 family endonuclease
MVSECSIPAALLDLPYPEPEPPDNLIFDDGIPLESNRHRIAMNALIRSMLIAYAERNDFFAGGNMFVYYSRNQKMNRDFRGPDFFVALNVDGNRERQGWVIWEEDGHYPDVIVELISPSTESRDRGEKKDLYERTFKLPNYFIYNPFKPDSLEGWQLDATQRYQPLTPNAQGWLWCEVLGLWLGTWEGVIDNEPCVGTCHWLRFYDAQGNLVPLPEEAAEQRADTAEQRAERLAEHLRQLGIDPNIV